MARIIDLVTNAGQVDVTKGIVEEAVKSCPEMQFFDADTVPGTTIATLARTSLPTVAFRNLGDPVSSSRSSYAERTATLKLLSGRVEISDAEVKKNGLQTKEEMQTDESIATMAAAFQHLAKQIWYGTGSDAKGFAGAAALVDAAMVTKAGAGSAGANTSVWFVGNGAKRACGIVFSKNSKIINGEDLTFHDGDIPIKETVTINDEQKEIVTGVEPGTIGDLTSFAAFLVDLAQYVCIVAHVPRADASVRVYVIHGSLLVFEPFLFRFPLCFHKYATTGRKNQVPVRIPTRDFSENPPPRACCEPERAGRAADPDRPP